MDVTGKHIITRLRESILQYEGFNNRCQNNHPDIGLDFIESAFPKKVFPLGCMHEFLSAGENDIAATNAFATALAARITQHNGICAWLSNKITVFPPALNHFGLEPHHVIFIKLKDQKDLLSATEECLKCNRFSVVLSELNDIDFNQSRRFQLAVEKSRVTGFLLRHKKINKINTIAAVSRLCISSLPTLLDEGMPGVGFPRWKIELQKVRNGTPGSWSVEYTSGTFKELKANIHYSEEQGLRKVS